MKYDKNYKHCNTILNSIININMKSNYVLFIFWHVFDMINTSTIYYHMCVYVCVCVRMC